MSQEVPGPSHVFRAIMVSRIVAVIRFDDPDCALDVASAVSDGGIKAIEFAFSERSALTAIEMVANKLGDKVAVGAGTVLDAETARSAILAGAQFIVTPSINLRVIELSHRYSIPVIPGALTPTEIITAWEAGAQIVKVFPASSVGPRYLTEIKGPFPQVRLMPTGGINAGNIADFIECGAFAVGVGGALASRELIRDRRWNVITQRACELVNAVKGAST